MNARNSNRASVKLSLFERLKSENAFWSYDVSVIKIDDISDDQFIAMTMRHLDLDDIDRLFGIFSYSKIKSAWKNLLLPQGDYLYTLNRFFAWYYFKAKNPDAYLKSLMTRRLNSMFS